MASAAVATAQRSTFAVDQYNEATGVEREGFEDRLGGPGSEYLRRSQRDCLVFALASYSHTRSRLAAWRIVSCASGAEYWLLAQLAADAFRTIEPAGIDGWSHPSFPEAEVHRVREAARTAARRVGSIQLEIPEGAQAFWAAAQPAELAPGALPPPETNFSRGVFHDGPVRVGSLLYGLVGQRISLMIRLADGSTRSVDDTFTPLAADTSNSAPLAQAIDARPNPPASELRPRSTTTRATPPVRLLEEPTRNELLRAIQSILPDLARCRRERDGQAISIRFTFDGVSGSVVNASPMGSLDAATAACISQAARGAQVQPFRRATFVFNYPVWL